MKVKLDDKLAEVLAANYELGKDKCICVAAELTIQVKKGEVEASIEVERMESDKERDERIEEQERADRELIERVLALRLEEAGVDGSKAKELVEKGVRA